MQNSSAAERVLASALAKTIRSRRTALGMTQEQVAAEADIDKNHYQLMESARSNRKNNSALNPRLHTLIRLSRVLECTVSDLIDDAINEYNQVDENYHSFVQYRPGTR
ncbi:helix-turn-helix domain-containing protein [Arcanobacterium bovis]|uniref:XRE family transcriptional regulator n=1 Tax=Arcanobacterium bovis TaxID=2529275 RepID=A0A4Q9V1R4_9ACTO|nr:helix-turn-helix transcriptional regulator [Arcanobacterium bovis]TBW22993.1 XRE family transcriptional regulator [Arcanobacterium bovis]